MLQNLPAESRSGLLHIILQDLLQFRNIVFLRDFLKRSHILIHPKVQRMIPVQNICDPAAHAGSEVLSGPAKDDRASACHVFQTMVPASFRNGCRSRISHAETFSGDAADIGLAGCRAIKRNIADNDIFMGSIGSVFRRNHHQLAARQAFAEPVIGIPCKADRQTFRNESSK